MRSHLAHLVNRGIRAVPLTAAPGKLLFLVLLCTTPLAAAADAPTERIEEAQLLMEAGAWSEAILRCDEAVDLAPRGEDAAQAHFLAGQCHEARGDLESAIERFGEAMAVGRGTAMAVDARFRRGLAWLELGEPRRAQRDFRHLRGKGAADLPVEVARLDLQLAACQHALGRERRATDLLLPALETLTEANAGATAEDGDPQTVWYLAQAHVLAGDLLSDEMDRVSMDVTSIEAQRERLDRRLELFREAKQHYQWAGHLSSPLWVCAGGYKLGQLHERLLRGLTAAPPPDYLSPTQQQVYLDHLHETVDRRQEGALAVYRDTLTYAASAGVQNRWVDLAQARLSEALAETLPD